MYAVHSALYCTPYIPLANRLRRPVAAFACGVAHCLGRAPDASRRANLKTGASAKKPRRGRRPGDELGLPASSLWGRRRRNSSLRRFANPRKRNRASASARLRAGIRTAASCPSVLCPAQKQGHECQKPRARLDFVAGRGTGALGFDCGKPRARSISAVESQTAQAETERAGRRASDEFADDEARYPSDKRRDV
jgi:hypothetical protein